MSPDEWERRLTAHYLRSDGPSGGAPIRFFDATPAELAIAAGRPHLLDAEAQALFLEQFDRWSVQRWLDGYAVPAAVDGDTPGYLRHLVLTCLVSATDEGAGSTNNFRIRLGELVDGMGPLNAVSRVNRLWRALAGWCDRRRAAGEPIREIDLPSPGSFTIIGHALKLAFPSWRDRVALTRILRRIPDAVRRSPRRLVAELDGQYWAGSFSWALQNAFRDFQAGLKIGRGDLADHRFWRLVQSIDERLQAETGAAAAARWRMELTFGGWEQDRLDVVVASRPRRGGAVARVWEGPFLALAEAPPPKLPDAIAKGLERGVFVFGEAAGAKWVLDDLGPHPGTTAVVLAHTGGSVTKRGLDTVWREVGAGWSVSGRLDFEGLSGLLRSLGLGGATDRLIELGFDDGVATRRAAWLGRPAYLPCVRASDNAGLVLAPVAGTEAALLLTPDRRLVAAESVDGRWRVTAHAGGGMAERTLVLEADAPERASWPPEHADWEPQRELVHGVEMQWVNRGDPGPASEPVAAVPDLLEAVYAGAGNGWPEGELVALLQRALPQPHLAWDVLRALAEAGWIEARLSRRWGARRWRLTPPKLVTIAPHTMLAEGAVSAKARRRLAETVSSAGGRLEARAGCGWTPDVLVVSGLDPGEAAALMEWPLETAGRPQAAPAPGCWPPEPRTIDGYHRRGGWSFDQGLFWAAGAPPELNGVRLERFVRERGDDRDLYLVTWTAGTWVSASRTCAILEAHRRAGRPLLRWTGTAVERIGRSGHLPLPIAQTLRRAARRAAGPAASSQSDWTYRYPCDEESARWAEDLLGAAFEGPARRRTPASLSYRVERRRAGLRPVWYAPDTKRARRAL